MAIRHKVAQGNLNSCSIRETSSLQAAIEAPNQVVFGQEMFQTVGEKAGALLHSLIEFHPFWDGNKRIAVRALNLFLQRNGAHLRINDEQLRAYTCEIAQGKLSRDQVIAWLTPLVEESA